MPDFQRMAKRFQTKKANLEDVVRAYNAALHLPEMVAILEEIGTSASQREGQRVINDEKTVALLDEMFLNKLRVGC